jgi:hypothetical protein
MGEQMRNKKEDLWIYKECEKTLPLSQCIISLYFILAGLLIGLLMMGLLIDNHVTKAFSPVRPSCDNAVRGSLWFNGNDADGQPMNDICMYNGTKSNWVTIINERSAARKKGE